MKKQTILMFTIVGVFTVSLFSINAYSQIAVGFAYVKNSRSGCGQFTTIGDYAWAYNPSGNGSLADLREEVEKKLEGDYPAADVLVETSKYRYAAIVKYTYKISGWDCYKTAYQVGFADSNSAASDKAEAKARSSCSNCEIESVAIHSW